MKQYILLILCTAALASCVTPKKLYQKDRYDDAVTALSKKLKKKPNKQKNIILIQRAYKKATEADMEAIAFLKKEGRPEDYEEIFNIYEKIRRRQGRVKRLPQLVDQKTRSVIYFEYINVDGELFHYKQKTAEYTYARAVKTLEAGGRDNARSAYNDFKQVKAYYSDFKDVDAMLNKSWNAGLSHVLFGIENNSRVILPREFDNEIKSIAVSDLNQGWVHIDVNSVSGKRYDFNVVLNITQIDVAPERVKEVRYTEVREVEDGWVYKKDKKGNVLKDSLGNDIKVPKIVRIECDVIETIQQKAAMVSGRLEITNNATGQLVQTIPVRADSHFEYVSLAAFGNLNALTKEKRRMIGRPVPFPDDFEMLLMCSEDFKRNAKKAISDNYFYMD